MELVSTRPHSPYPALRWATWAHSGPDALEAKMPGFAPGTQKVVRGLSRVSSASPARVSTTVTDSSTTRFDLRSLSTALFGSTPPSDDESPLRATASSLSDSTSISPPPAYATIYPPSPPLSAASSPVSSLSGSEDDGEAEKRRYRLPVELDDAVPTNLLAKIFPDASPVHQFPTTNIILDDLVPSFQGAVLNNAAAGTRTLYVGGGDYEDLDLRETVCGILERAEEELGCTGVVLALEKSTPHLGELLHSLLYVGGVITTGPFNSKTNYLLVGLDL